MASSCPPPSSLSMEEALKIDENDKVLSIVADDSRTAVTSNGGVETTPQVLAVSSFIASDLEDLEQYTMIRLQSTTSDSIFSLLPKLESLLLQQRKRGNRVRVITKIDIPDWGSPLVNNEEQNVYENDCRFQMRMQRR